MGCGEHGGESEGTTKRVKNGPIPEERRTQREARL